MTSQDLAPTDTCQADWEAEVEEERLDRRKVHKQKQAAR